MKHSTTLDTKPIIQTLKSDARALGIPSGAADSFINLSVAAATKSLKHKSIITSHDLDRALIKELKKYHADLAYVYENRGTII